MKKLSVNFVENTILHITSEILRSEGYKEVKNYDADQWNDIELPRKVLLAKHDEDVHKGFRLGQ